MLDEATREAYIERYAEANEKKELAKKKQAMSQLKSGRTDASDDEDGARPAMKRKVAAQQPYYDVVEPREINAVI